MRFFFSLFDKLGQRCFSFEDVALTREIVKAGQLMDIDTADHIVVAQGGRFVSLRERGMGF